MPTPLRHNGGNTHSDSERDDKMARILQLKAQGKSQAFIAEEVKVSQGTISRWLRLPRYADMVTGPMGKRVAEKIRDQLGAHGEAAAAIAENAQKGS
jgi:hypothetical protein